MNATNTTIPRPERGGLKKNAMKPVEPTQYIRDTLARELVEAARISMQDGADKPRAAKIIGDLLVSVRLERVESLYYDYATLAYVLDDDVTEPDSVLGETMRWCRGTLRASNWDVPTISRIQWDTQCHFEDMVACGMGKEPSPYEIF